MIIANAAEDQTGCLVYLEQSAFALLHSFVQYGPLKGASGIAFMLAISFAMYMHHALYTRFGFIVSFGHNQKVV